MAITTTDELLDAFTRQQTWFYMKYGLANDANAGYFDGSWLKLGSYVGEIPPTGSGEQCFNSTPGSIPLNSPTPPRKLYLASFGYSGNIASGAWLVDRMVHTSGLNGNIATEQTVDTVALPPRAGNGKDVLAFMQVWAQLGTTSRNATITYTNSDGVSGRQSTAVVPGTARNGCLIPFGLAPGDVGVQSVQSVVLNAGTGAVGNFGIVLAKQLAFCPNAAAYSGASLSPIALMLPEVGENACLNVVPLAASTTSATFWASITLVEG